VKCKIRSRSDELKFDVLWVISFELTQDRSQTGLQQHLNNRKITSVNRWSICGSMNKEKEEGIWSHQFVDAVTRLEQRNSKKLVWSSH